MTTHIVQAGETLGAIAQKYLGSASAYTKIAEHNNIANPNSIAIGTELEIPLEQPQQAAQQESAAAQQEPAAPAASSDEAFQITVEQLSSIINSSEKAEIYCDAINQCLTKYNISSPLRVAHFIAQICHESGHFRFTKENLNYSAKALRAVFGKYFPDDQLAEQYARKPEMIANRVYGNRMGNGDEQSGEGWAYRGRGLIQLTGKDNYQKFSAAHDIDAISNPDQVSEDPELCVAVAGWYWNERNLNEKADADDAKKITYKINGGYNGLEERLEILNNAKQLFGLN